VLGETIYVTSVSGGKDSAAAVLHLREQEKPQRLVFFDTGWEHALTYTHLDYLQDAFGLPIERWGCAVDLPEHLVEQAEKIEAVLGIPNSAFVRLCLKKTIFPRRTVRFCTQFLKVFEAVKVIRQEHDAGRLPINVVGIRAAESAARSKLGEYEVSPTLDCMVWRPLIRWSEQDVIDIHRRHNIKPNPLYLQGASRVGCFPCIMARKAELRMVGRDANRVEAIRMLEAAVRESYRAKYVDVATFNPPTLFTASRRDSNGDRPGVLIDEALRWAATADGVPLEQERLFPEQDDPDEGCMRWGMCDMGGSDD
jgi:3'-phosphoadenosine 5'-phosphosulfate sulfotransferase (PAPS reductase)/FAD synthetase